MIEGYWQNVSFQSRKCKKNWILFTSMRNKMFSAQASCFGSKCLLNDQHTLPTPFEMFYLNCSSRALLFKRWYSTSFVILKSVWNMPHMTPLQTAQEQISTYIILFVCACRWCSAALPWCDRVHVIYWPCGTIYIFAQYIA